MKSLQLNSLDAWQEMALLVFWSFGPDSERDVGKNQMCQWRWKSCFKMCVGKNISLSGSFLPESFNLARSFF
jgi:hypothetical protein